MSIIKEKYKRLLPSGDALADIVVLAQAWKKSHTYIRRHNWYADVLELDSSTIDLEERLGRWAKDIANPEFFPEALRLVPAPKNARWEFTELPDVSAGPAKLMVNFDFGQEATFDDWVPTKVDSSPNEPLQPSASGQKLRPLAHVSIRDQTLATAVMMCLAEAVENAQGDPSEKDIFKARARGTVSYGNRLHCRWTEQSDGLMNPHFSWGNSLTYRQYFDDYRTFLARPRKVCAEFSNRLSNRKELYVISLDIKSFFDCVDRNALLGELYRIESSDAKGSALVRDASVTHSFWSRTGRIFSWSWNAEDSGSAELINGNAADALLLGLPQGLVASGFFANAYLLGFDAELNAQCVAGLEVGEGIKVLDYCRYVDDLRLVVEAPSPGSSAGSQTTLNVVKKYVGQLLANHCHRIGAKVSLQFSENKSAITPYRSISAQSNVSALMEVLNAELSGTFDLESLTQTGGGLEGLLWMADQIEDLSPTRRSRLSLASITTPHADVRDDTVKRFVATRLAQLLRHRLAMTDTESPAGESVVLSENVRAGTALAHEFEQLRGSS